MGLSRNTLLWASRNNWLRNRVPNLKFVQRALNRFMPGTTAKDAIVASKELIKHNIPTTLTHLGENITTIKEAEENTQHYLSLLENIRSGNLDVEISLKLTQIGLDQSFEKALELCTDIVKKADKLNNNVFIDIEDSSYVDSTISFYKKIKENYDNVGLCLQAYLYRTMDDVKGMIDINPWIRLVKGAYKEPAPIAFPKMKQVNENFIYLSKYLLEQIREKGIRIAFGTHDLIIQKQVKREANKFGLNKKKIEFQMLYGIKTNEQYRLAADGYKIRTLISYGEHWYPWYLRRLAERPANVGFVLKYLFSKKYKPINTISYDR